MSDDMPWVIGLTDEEVQELRTNKQQLTEYGRKKIQELMSKEPTLYDKLEEWYEFGDHCQSKDVIVNEIINIIKDWLPKEQSAAGSQNVYVECTVEGYNDCLNKIKRKLR